LLAGKANEAPDLSDAEKAAIHYADLAASNHLAISDETLANLRKYYSEKEIVELCMYVAYCVGFGRMLQRTVSSRSYPRASRIRPRRSPVGG